MSLDEGQARRSEASLIQGHVWRLSKSDGLNADQRIGVCMALKVLDDRVRELKARRADDDFEMEGY